MSGGQQQRVSIARALAQEAKIILADEPVASLDPLTTRQVMDDLKRINTELGITTVVNLHFIDLAREYATRIIGLRAGKVVYDGPVSEATDDVFSEIYGRAIKKDELLGGAGGMSVTTVKKPPRTKIYLIALIMVLFLIGSIYQTDATLTKLVTGTPEILKFIAEMFPPDWLFFADIWKPMAQTCRCPLLVQQLEPCLHSLWHCLQLVMLLRRHGCSIQLDSS